MAELTWIVSKILDCNGKPCDWVIVSPTGGTGSATPTITINEGVGPNDCEEAYVYISASTNGAAMPSSACAASMPPTERQPSATASTPSTPTTPKGAWKPTNCVPC